MLGYIFSLSFLIALILIIRAVFRKKVSPRWIYALWIVVVFRMIIPISFFEIDLTLPDYIYPSDITSEQSFSTNPPISDYDTNIDLNSEIIYNPTIGNITDIPNGDIAPPNDILNDTINDPVIDNNSNKVNITRIFDIVWALGALVVGACILITSVSFNLRLKHDREMHRIVSSTAVYISSSVKVPCVAGFVPAIYLTPEIANSKSETLTIIHEKIHLRHGDHIWGIVRALALTVFWYNPLVWAAAVMSKRDAELACDDTISAKIDNDVRLQYANILLNTAVQTRRHALELGGAPMKERILMLTKKHSYKLISLILALFLAVISIACSFISVNNSEDEEDEITRDDSQSMNMDDDHITLLSQGPFVGYVADSETPWIELYIEKNGDYVGRIPYNIFHDWTATDRDNEAWESGWMPEYIKLYYAEFGDFRWAAAHLQSTVMGSGRKNIATSSDGGETWNVGSIADNYGGNHVTGIGFESAKVAVMCFDSMYEHDIFTEEGMVLPIVLSRTEDSGKTWTRTEIAVPSYLENYRTRPSVPKFDGAVGRIPIDVYDADYKVVDTVYLVSLDAGLTWEWEDKHFDPDEFASYIPNETAKFEFWHNMFASETYLYFCSVREYNSDGASYTDAPPRDFAVYYVDASDPSTIGRIDAKLPEELEYDSVMPVFAGGGGGSGECMFILRLTNNEETFYVQFNNFSYTDNTDWLEFKYGGVVSDDLLEYLMETYPENFS